MLVEFTFSNFASFREPATLSMVASRDTTMPDNTFKTGTSTKEHLLRSAVIYGANASGKSNLIKAIRFMQWFVARSFKSLDDNDPIPLNPFKLDEKCLAAPSNFEMAFIFKKVRYEYGFSLNSKAVISEWLYSYPKKQPRLLFERLSKGRNYTPTVKYGTFWKGNKKSLNDILRPNCLLISAGAQANSPIAEDIYYWFTQTLSGIETTPHSYREEEYTKSRTMNDDKFKVNILSFLSNADIPVKDIIVEAMPFSETALIDSMQTEEERKVLEKVISVLPKEKDLEILETYFIHQGKDKDGRSIDVRFEYEDESDGTKQLFVIAGPLLSVLKQGACLVVDELDTNLHPLLTWAIVSLFHSSKTNPKGAQLIFASHDSSLMDINQLFRRDQIWFTVRDQLGSSKLFSLWDFKKTPRKGENVINGYLAGRYGAIPILDDLVVAHGKEEKA